MGKSTYIGCMSAPDIDQEMLNHFEPLTREAHLTFLLGAGASAPSGLPNWEDFAAHVAVLSGLVSRESAARTLLSRQDPSIVLEAARLQSGDSWEHDLMAALYGDLGHSPEPSPLHLAVVGHYLHFPRRTTLSTLNFDILLETAFIETSSQAVETRFDGKESGELPTIHHLHGAITEEFAIEPVVGYQDYAELVADNDAWQYHFLTNALSRGPLLLAGTSYRDPDIRHWLHMIFSAEKQRYPAIVTIVREGMRLNRKMFSSLSDALTKEWEAIGLTALKMHDLTDVALIIRELQFLKRSDYQSPKTRAQQVWSRHNERIADLQSLYSETLFDNAKTVTQAIGVEAHQATLWLATGDGTLARWASQGTQYQGPEFMKYVPTGHDNPWIAGGALGAEEVKLRDMRRKRKARPNWKSVLAVPIFCSSRNAPDFATAVLTFGLSKESGEILPLQELGAAAIEELSSAWSSRISQIAFPATDS